MNIFVLDRNPERGARYHCDKHVVKMVLETAQLLSTQLWIVNEPLARQLQARGLIYRATHRNHPCAVWTGQSLGNYLWLCRLGRALAEEFSFRYQGRLHASEAVIEHCRQLANRNPERIIKAGSLSRRLTAFALAMPDRYKREDPVLAYRALYAGEKAYFCTWTRRRTPEWFVSLTRQAESTHCAKPV